MTRSEAREQAFLLVFEQSMNRSDMSELISSAKETRDFHEDPYTINVASGVMDHLDELDRCISQCSSGWKISRISKVALAALRVALFEMHYLEEIPVSVSINEAVELCKKYATQEDASFVNGILGSVAKSLPEKEPV